MTPFNPYAPPAAAEDISDSTEIRWENRLIEIRGEAIATRLWTVIGYTIEIDGAETFSNTQVRGTDDFCWRFNHQERIAEARFEPIGWQRLGCLHFRLQIDGVEIACQSVAVRGFGYYLSFYFFVLIGIFLSIPAALLILELLT